MNYSMVLYVLGWILNFEGLLMIPPLLIALIYRERVGGMSLLITMIVCGVIGFIVTRRKPKKMRLYAREGFVITALSWFVLSIFGAIPFVISGFIPNIIDAVFETASGFTTTGASILPTVEQLPKSLLFWRSFTHWVGGMGVLVFMMAILPMAGAGSDMYLMKAESPGPSVKKLVPKVKQTASALYKMYIVITLLEFISLLIVRMPVFDAITITFGTAGTGGFAVTNSGLGGYSIPIQVIVTIFMIAFGINFSAYYLIWKKRFKDALQMSEVLVYLAIIGVSIVLITINIMPMYTNGGLAVKDAAFQVGSIITTTGFGTADFNLWPTFSKAILVMLMFVGACAGSTGGGMKVSRIIILAKSVWKELNYIVHPNSIRKIKVDGKQLEHAVLRAVNTFVAAYLIVFTMSVLVICLNGFDFESSFTAVAATLNNIGPALGVAGPASNYSMFSGISKIVLTFDMIAGRLELWPILILLAPSTWKK